MSSETTHGDPTKDKYLQLDRKLGAAEQALAADLGEAGRAFDPAHAKLERKVNALSDETKEANEWADEVAAKQEARAKNLNRRSDAFVDDRAAELDRAVANAEASAQEGMARAREEIERAREKAPRAKGKRPAS